MGLVTCPPESGRLQLNCRREERPSRNLTYESAEYVVGGDILPTPRKTYPSSDSGNPSSSMFCGLVQLGMLWFDFSFGLFFLNQFKFFKLG